MLTEGGYSTWLSLGQVPIRNVHLYQHLDLPFAKDCLHSCCPFGGPLAVARKIDNTTWEIVILTSNGEYLASINAIDVSHLFWTRKQELIVLHENGNIILYSVHGHELASFDLEPEIRQRGFIHATVFYKRTETGFFIMDRSQMMYFVNDVIHRICWKMMPPKGAAISPSCYTIVCIEDTTSIVLCYGEQFYIGHQGSSVQPINRDWMYTDGKQYLGASTSWDNEKIAFVHSSSCVSIVTSNLEYLLHTVVLSPHLLNLNPCWCGSDVLVFSKNSNGIMFYSMSGDECAKDFPSDVWYARDSDGLRVFQKNEAFLMTVVPGAVAEVFGLLSETPGALLLEAYLSYGKKDYLAFDYLQKIRKNLHNAIEQCLNAAAHHFDVSTQKELISAVQFGKAMFYNYDSERFVDITSTLRCLNATRSVGLPISFAEFNEMGLPHLIQRLIDLHHWPLALEICKAKNISNTEGAVKVISHWIGVVFDKFLNSGKLIDANFLASKIFEHVSKLSIPNYADIAEVVLNKDRKKFAEVANLVLERESDTGKRVQMLLKFGNTKAALELANESHLPHLAYMVISHLKGKEKSGEVDRMLLRKNVSTAKLYQGFVREDNPKILLALYEQQDDFTRQAVLHLASADKDDNVFDPSSKNEWLGKAERCFSKLDNQNLVNLIKLSINLSKQNAEYDNAKRTNLINESVRDTFIYAMGEGNDLELAEKLKKEHRLSEKQVWKWTIDAYIKNRNKNNLNDITFKKQFTGYLSFVESAVKYNQMDFASEYVMKIPVSEDKIKALCLMGRFLEAAEVAWESNDVEALQRLISLYSTGAERLKIMELYNQVRARLAAVK